MTTQTRELPPFPLPSNMSLKELQSIAEVGMMMRMLEGDWEKDQNFLILASLHMRMKRMEEVLNTASKNVLDKVGNDLVDIIKQMKKEKDDGQ